MSMHGRLSGASFAAALILGVGALTAPPAMAQSVSSGTGDPSGDGFVAESAPAAESVATFAEVGFAHPVSLETATTVRMASGLDVQGYHFVSDAIIGDYWPDAGLSVDEFLENIENATGTAPEIVSAYVVADELNAAIASRGAPVALGADLPAFDAPDADPSLAVPPKTTEDGEDSPGVQRAAGDTWQPNDVEVQVRSMADNLAISAKYAWWGLSPFASPQVMANHWGMEFQFDFYTTLRQNTQLPSIGYGSRPNCGATTLWYKDWAAASTRPYSWFGWVIVGPDIVAAPASLGLYGDFNDLSDPCNVSTIAVGMAQPHAMPGSGNGQYLDLYLYPLKGDDSQSTLGAIVQPVSRAHCEANPSMPLMDCMGVTAGAYPGPGSSSSRMVLNNTRGKKAPNLCWYSGDFGTSSASFWSC